MERLGPVRAGRHRTFLAKTRFRRFSVKFANGTQIEAWRDDGADLGKFAISIYEHAELAFQVSLPTDASGNIPKEFNSDLEIKFSELLERLRKLRIVLFFLSDDRKIESHLPNPEAESVHLVDMVWSEVQGVVTPRRKRDRPALSIANAVERAEGWPMM